MSAATVLTIFAVIASASLLAVGALGFGAASMSDAAPRPKDLFWPLTLSALGLALAVLIIIARN